MSDMLWLVVTIEEGTYGPNDKLKHIGHSTALPYLLFFLRGTLRSRVSLRTRLVRLWRNSQVRLWRFPAAREFLFRRFIR